MLFTCYIRPILEYACIVWSPQTAKNSFLIEYIQRKFVKAIFARCGVPFSSYDCSLSCINESTLSKRCVVASLIMTYNIFNSKVNIPPETMFASSPTSSRTRSRVLSQLFDLSLLAL
ncbi:hypothetical protein L596_013434 [Steinernema carpocapsae]|uniref:Uncharacterized protein n=1 Tax=Steinernema carpocapsae TaxID=34508 RepID=A0A4U5P072_STECR|nr:hypothetical protein L596_013434 [Steinernema carpocapsae]